MDAAALPSNRSDTGNGAANGMSRKTNDKESPVTTQLCGWAELAGEDVLEVHLWLPAISMVLRTKLWRE